MIMNRREVFELLVKYNRGKFTDEEQSLLETWYVNQKLNHIDLPEDKIYEDLEMIARALPQPQPARKVSLWFRIMGAACAVLMVGATVYYFTYPKAKIAPSLIKEYDVPAGKNIAVLKLSNGKTIQLSDTKQGVVIGSNAISYNDGSLVKNSGHEGVGTQEISTPPGGQYTVELPDGTKVWLNAASSLTYHTNLNKEPGKPRAVKLVGEAYFEVARHKNKKFIIENLRSDGKSGQTVEVLGTHFNINSYADEVETRTTLLEGSIRINTQTNETVLLKPGQKATLTANGEITVGNGDMEVASWKDGKFRFNEASLQTVLRQLARWYDVKIAYEGKIPDRRFTGYIDRRFKLSEALKVLETLDIHFRLGEKEIIVGHKQ